MQIDPRAALARLSAARTGTAGRAGGGFALSDAAEQGRSTSASAVATPASLDALIALQGEDTPQERKRRNVQHGRDLLDGLDRLKAALLSGRVATSDLQRIASELARRPATSGDPRLDDLVGQIELRAQVELAKLRQQAGT